jgi:hypothetical protein
MMAAAGKPRESVDFFRRRIQTRVAEARAAAEAFGAAAGRVQES